MLLELSDALHKKFTEKFSKIFFKKCDGVLKEVAEYIQRNNRKNPNKLND